MSREAGQPPHTAGPAVAPMPEGASARKSVPQRRILVAEPWAAALRHSILSVYLAAVAQGAVGVMLPASSAILRGRLGIGDTLYGALYLPGLALAFLAALLGRVLLLRWSLKQLFLFALLSQAASMALLAMSPSFGRGAGLAVLFGALALSGPAGGIMGITLNTAAVEIFPKARSAALAALHGLLGVGASFGPILVAFAAQLGAWAAAPFALAGLLAVMALLAGLRPIVGLADVRAAEPAPADMPARLKLRALTAFLYAAGEATLTAWAVLFLRENRGLPVAVAASALSAFWIAMTAGRLGSAALVRRVPPFALALVLSLMMAAAFLVVRGSEGAVDSMLRFGFAGLACSALFPLLLGLASAEFPERTTQVTAVMSAAVLAGLALGCFGVGAVRGSLGLDRVYLIGAGWSAALAAVVAGLARGRALRIARS